MDKICITYRPFRQMIVLAYSTAALGICAFLLAGACIMRETVAVAVFATFGVALMLGVKHFYDMTNVIVLFMDSGISVLNDGKIKFTFMPWEDLLYARYYRSIKGFSYVALSKKPIDREWIKDMVMDNDLSKRICVDDNAIMLNLTYEDATEIRRVIAEKVPTICGGTDNWH